MNKINNTSVVKQQYANANNLNTRISIHDKYSTNKMGFGNWIMSNYRIDEKMKVLELGCGTGDMWKNSQSLIKACSKLILSDFSEGMVATTKSNIGNYENTEYKVIDIQEIPYENETFDVVIANMMLYHVPDDIADPESWIFPEISDSVEYPGTGWDWRQLSGRGISGVECL